MSETAHETFGFNCADKLIAADAIKKEDRSRVAAILGREYDQLTRVEPMDYERPQTYGG